MERPDKIRVRRHGGFATVEMTYDGKLLSVVNSDAKVYGQSEVSGTVDDLIDTLGRTTGYRSRRRTFWPATRARSFWPT